MTEIKHIGVLTSGGDAPGMNAAIRAVVRTSIDYGWEVSGIRHGFSGLLAQDIINLAARDVGGILQRGGTFLGSARCSEFKTPQGQQHALNILKERKIDALVVIGGNGSQTGAYSLSKQGFPVVGIASTIDNDLYGSDITIGVDTALNIALEAIDRLRTTASSHNRAFLIELMGRDCGYLALAAGIAGGAEYIVIPEMESDPEAVATEIRNSYARGKSHAIVVVAEGAHYNAARLDLYFKEHKERLGFDLRVSTLGHIQRGGIPSSFDRLLATRLAIKATESLAKGLYGVLAGTINGQITTTPLKEVVNRKKDIDLELFRLASILAK